MPSIIVYTNPLTPGNAQMPVFTVGDDQNWSLQFNDGTNFYNPTGVMMNIGFVRGLPDATYASAFQWVDRLNNIHTASMAIASGLPGTLTWDETPIGVAGDNGAWLVRGRTPPSSSIRKVYVKFGGTGTTVPPALRFFGGGVPSIGYGATATATVAAGAVNAVTAVNQGFNYSSTTPPEVIVIGDGTGAIVVTNAITTGRIVSYTIVAGGSGYTSAIIMVRDAEASATPTVGGSSGVTGASVVNPGSGYTTAPTITFSSGAATATAALLNSTWGLKLLTLTNAGSGYTSPPTVGFSGGTGTGAAAVCTVDSYQGVTGVTLVYGGLYAGPSPGVPPTITATISGGGGTGATASVIALQHADDGVNWTIANVVIGNNGSGYSGTPTIAFTSNTTVISAANVTLITGTGQITSITLTNAGSGYGATAPTVSFTGGGGSSAAATVSVIGSPITPVITITAAGSGYTTPPTMSFSGGGGTGASAVALCSFGITAVTVNNPGYAYTSLPSIVSYPDGGAVLVPAGIESHTVPFIQNLNPATAQGAITVTPYTNGRQDVSGNLIYDDSLLIVRPRYLVQPTLTLQSDGLTWAGVFTPVTTMVQAVLNYRRSFVADVEIFGGGRLLFTGSLTIAAA